MGSDGMGCEEPFGRENALIRWSVSRSVVEGLGQNGSHFRRN